MSNEGENGAQNGGQVIKVEHQHKVVKAKPGASEPTKLEEEFQAIKTQIAEEFPDIADVVEKCESVKELKTLIDLRREAEKGEPEKPVVLSKTGGQIPLYPSRPPADLTEEAPDAKTLINSLYDEVEKLRLKRSFGELSKEERDRLRVLELKREALFDNLVKGERARGRITHFFTFRCPVCGDAVAGRVCERCGYTYGERIDPSKRRLYQLGA